MTELRRIGEEFLTITAANAENVLMGVWPCVDQDAVNECIRTIIIDQIENQGVFDSKDKVGHDILERAKKAKTEQQVTGVRITFEEESQFEFDIFTQHMWSVKDGMKIMKESIDEKTKES